MDLFEQGEDSRDPDSDPYQVRLEMFEGPLDLLLHLIRKNEINIYDIPIALIASQYMTYLDAVRSLNLSVAGEFLVMAATLLKIKSKMLLPTEEAEQDDEDGPDPREELVRQLLEYKQFKEAARELDGRERLWRDVFGKEPVPLSGEPAPEITLDTLTLFDLVDALQGVIARLPQESVLEIMPEHLTVHDRMNVILEKLEGEESVAFLSLFEGEGQRAVVIVTFLALLELVRIKVIRVFQTEMFGSILVTRAYSLVTEGDGPDTSESVDQAEEG